MVIPEENRKDLAEIPDEIKDGLTITPVRWIDEVLDIALSQSPSGSQSDEKSDLAAGVTGSEEKDDEKNESFRHH